MDDAHGFGVLGKSGQGALEAAQLTPSGETIMMATLSKAMGGYGAFVAADDLYIEHLVQFARSYIYTTALPPSVAASGFEALRFYRERGSELRSKLQSNIEYFKQSSHDLGLALLPSSTAIQPILIGDSASATRISQALFDDGLNVVAIRPPTVPSGAARLRVALSAVHTRVQIDRLVESLSKHSGSLSDD